MGRRPVVVASWRRDGRGGNADWLRADENRRRTYCAWCRGCWARMVTVRSCGRAVLDGQLVTAGYDVCEADDGRPALLLAAQASPRLVALDAGLSGPVGLAVGRWLKRRHPVLPVLMTSASAGEAASRQFDLPALLLRSPRRVFRRAELLEAVWGWAVGDQSTVTVQLRRSREKPDVDPASPPRVGPAYGIGHRFEPAAVRCIGTSASATSGSGAGAT